MEKVETKNGAKNMSSNVWASMSTLPQDESSPELDMAHVGSEALKKAAGALPDFTL